MTTTFVDPHYAYGTATVANAATLGQNEINITLLWREFQYRHAQNRVRRAIDNSWHCTCSKREMTGNWTQACTPRTNTRSTFPWSGTSHL